MAEVPSSILNYICNLLIWTTINIWPVVVNVLITEVVINLHFFSWHLHKRITNEYISKMYAISKGKNPMYFGHRNVLNWSTNVILSHDIPNIESLVRKATWNLPLVFIRHFFLFNIWIIWPNILIKEQHVFTRLSVLAAWNCINVITHLNVRLMKLGSFNKCKESSKSNVGCVLRYVVSKDATITPILVSITQCEFRFYAIIE